MKTKFFLILALILVFAVVACTKSDDAPDESPETSSTFRATVLEVYEKSLLVEAEEGSWERGSGGEISVSTGRITDEESLNYLANAQVGDVVDIVYDGELAETYPAQILHPYSVRSAG